MQVITHIHTHTHRLSGSKNTISHLYNSVDKLKEIYQWSGKSNERVISKHRAKIKEREEVRDLEDASRVCNQQIIGVPEELKEQMEKTK